MKTEKVYLFFAGLTAAASALIIQAVLMALILIKQNNYLLIGQKHSLSFFALLAFVEELAKWIFLKKLFSKMVKNSITNAILFGLGFSAIETVFILLSLERVNILSLITVVLLHVTTVIIISTGNLFSKLQYVFLVSAVLIHTTFNLVTQNFDLDLTTKLLLIVSLFFFSSFQILFRKDQLAK